MNDPRGHWCDFCQTWHTSISCFHPANIGAQSLPTNNLNQHRAAIERLWKAAKELSYSPHCTHDTEEWHDGKCLVCNCHEAVEALRPLFVGESHD